MSGAPKKVGLYTVSSVRGPESLQLYFSGVAASKHCDYKRSNFAGNPAVFPREGGETLVLGNTVPNNETNVAKIHQHY